MSSSKSQTSGAAAEKLEKRKVVTCSHCNNLVDAEEVLKIHCEPCPGCSRLAKLAPGSEDIYECHDCWAPNHTTWFTIRDGEPFTDPNLVHVPPLREMRPEELLDPNVEKAYKEARAHRTVSSIRKLIEAQGKVVEAEEAAKTVGIIRRCVNAKCDRYCWPIKNNVLECSACKGRLIQCSEERLCENPRCEARGKKPKFWYDPIAEGRCRECGEVAVRRPGKIYEEIS